MRMLIGMAFACTVGFVATMALIRFGPHNAGITVAAIAAAVLVIELINAVRRTRRRAADKAWHPSSADLLWADARRVVRRDGR